MSIRNKCEKFSNFCESSINNNLDVSRFFGILTRQIGNKSAGLEFKKKINLPN